MDGKVFVSIVLINFYIIIGGINARGTSLNGHSKSNDLRSHSLDSNNSYNSNKSSNNSTNHLNNNYNNDYNDNYHRQHQQNQQYHQQQQHH